jgi:hypothetical protein
MVIVSKHLAAGTSIALALFLAINGIDYAALRFAGFLNFSLNSMWNIPWIVESFI